MVRPQTIFGLSREGDKKDISIEASHEYGGKCWRSGVCHSRRNHLLHLLNDVMQALLAAIDPMLKSGFALSFGQIGVLMLIFRVTASLLQPMGGLYTDRRPQPYSLLLGMACSLIGMVTLAKHLMYWSASKDHRSGPIDLHSPP